jgi:hypothetical protein
MRTIEAAIKLLERGVIAHNWSKLTISIRYWISKEPLYQLMVVLISRIIIKSQLFFSRWHYRGQKKIMTKDCLTKWICN